MMKMNRIATPAIMMALLSTTIVAVPAEAHGRNGRHHNHHREYPSNHNYSRYESRHYDRSYRSNDYRRSNYRGCDNGTGGTVIGAIAGGLIGNEVAGRGSKTEGTIIGAAIGAIGGRAIDKADDPCRRR